jgi:hypothetical protein
MKFKTVKRCFKIKYDTEQSMGNKISYFARLRDLSLFINDVLLVFPSDYENKRLVIEHFYTAKDAKNRDLLIIRFKSFD